MYTVKFSEKSCLHTGIFSSFLVQTAKKRPQGCQVCQKNWKDLRFLTLVCFCANIQLKLKKLQKSFKINKKHQKMTGFFDTPGTPV